LNSDPEDKRISRILVKNQAKNKENQGIGHIQTSSKSINSKVSSSLDSLDENEDVSPQQHLVLSTSDNGMMAGTQGS
jgi:hypothetical protein